MKFVEIELLSLPKIVFAYSVEISKYSHRFSNYRRFFEICFHEGGAAECRYPDGTVQLECPGMINTVTYLDDIVCSSSGSGINRHTTVGVDMDYIATRYASEDECDIEALKVRMKEKYIILIPLFEIVDDIGDKIVSIIKSIGISFYSDEPSEKTAALSKWLSLTSLLTDYVVKRLDNMDSRLPPSEHMYASKAVRYINENYAKKITVDQIAEHLELSCGHLQRLFHRVKGMSVVEYINLRRVTEVANMMTTQGISLREAALNVGVADPAYMSRLFKKVTGLSCREYLRQKSKF